MVVRYACFRHTPKIWCFDLSSGQKWWEWPLGVFSGHSVRDVAWVEARGGKRMWAELDVAEGL